MEFSPIIRADFDRIALLSDDGWDHNSHYHPFLTIPTSPWPRSAASVRKSYLGRGSGSTSCGATRSSGVSSGRMGRVPDRRRGLPSPWAQDMEASAPLCS